MSPYHLLIRINLMLSAIFISSFCFAQNNFIINGYIPNSTGKKVFLFNNEGGGSAKRMTSSVDSTYAKNDRFRFQGTFAELSYYSISLDSINSYPAKFIIDTGELKLTGTTKNLFKTIKVNSPQNEIERTVAIKVDSLYALREKFQELMLSNTPTDSVKTFYYSSLMDSVDLAIATYLRSVVQHFQGSYYAFNLMDRIYDYTPKVTQVVRKTFDLFSEELKQSNQGKKLKFKLFDFDKKKLLNTNFPNVSFYDQNESISKIKFEKQKTYLIDYWASWCVPCIAKMPSLKNLYEKYREKGFEVVGISLDTKQERWRQAVIKQDLYWSNYRALDAFNSDDVVHFGFNAIPFTILIGNNGKILKLNPTFDELEHHLSEQIRD